MEKKRILIADDEEVVRILLPEALGLYDYEIDVVENGVEAISHIDKRSYDLIITDYMISEMDGLELTQRIKAKYPYIPILIVTCQRTCTLSPEKWSHGLYHETIQNLRATKHGKKTS